MTITRPRKSTFAVFIFLARVRLWEISESEQVYDWKFDTLGDTADVVEEAASS